MHAAHNFGSMLQTYALQNFIVDLCKENHCEADYRVINLINDFQKSFYSNNLRFNYVNNVIKSLFKIIYKKQLDTKYKKFEEFLSSNINLTEEYTDETLSETKINADYYISGSDQVFNIRSKDFSWRYLLDFVSEGKKISYSASCGPLMIDWSQYDAKRYCDCVEQFDCCSVREDKSKLILEQQGIQNISVNVDPTLLLTKNQWQKIQSNANYNDGNYIFLYCLEPTKHHLDMAKAISKKLNLPVLVTRYNSKVDIVNPFVKKYDSGPCDFLSYINNAKLVLTSSFHGTAFSLIYNKNFYVLSGQGDNRISFLIEGTDLTHRVLNCIEDVEKVNLEDVDFSKTNEFLKNEKEKSAAYLKQALDLTLLKE